MQDFELEKKSSEPLYSQIKTGLENFIDKKLLDGERVPSENELKTHFRVNRLTARRALLDLESAGLIYSVRGKGRFKSSSASQRTLMKNSCFAVFGGQVKSAGGGGFYAPFMNRLFEIQREKDCTIKIVDENELGRLPEISRNWKNFKGLIWTVPDNECFSKMRELKNSGIPVIGILRNLNGSEFPYVFIEQRKSSMELVSMLVSSGHKKIGCICSDTYTNQTLPTNKTV